MLADSAVWVLSCRRAASPARWPWRLLWMHVEDSVLLLATRCATLDNGPRAQSLPLYWQKSHEVASCKEIEDVVRVAPFSSGSPATVLSDDGAAGPRKLQAIYNDMNDR